MAHLGIEAATGTGCGAGAAAGWVWARVRMPLDRATSWTPGGISCGSISARAAVGI
ncbi:hypothetical protein [Streptomyces sp. NPDC007988]|uniref:hypothetical protein n=1 Tax=Streptomyces sp. NPDC007988 TaxID=3364802 RepID=UPI0036E67971